MAQVAAASDRGGNLLEIGAGSGALTRALLARFGRERLKLWNVHHRWPVFYVSVFHN
jgi:phospholipid N-methyltransferase